MEQLKPWGGARHTGSILGASWELQPGAEEGRVMSSAGGLAQQGLRPWVWATAGVLSG